MSSPHLVGAHKTLRDLWRRKVATPCDKAAAQEPKAEARYDALIASLPDRTGHDLGWWLHLLSASAFSDRNSTIDHLRLCGFTFPEASMLERTHELGHSPFETTERLPTAAGREAPLQTAPPRRRRDSARVAVDDRTTPFPRWRSSEEHAKRLVSYLAEKNWRVGEVLSREVQAAYVAMCDELGWQPVGWRTVGSAFRHLIGDRKHYRHLVVNGRRHRWCVYSLPAHDQAAGGENFAGEMIPVAVAA